MGVDCLVVEMFWPSFFKKKKDQVHYPLKAMRVPVAGKKAYCVTYLRNKCPISAVFY